MENRPDMPDDNNHSRISFLEKMIEHFQSEIKSDISKKTAELIIGFENRKAILGEKISRGYAEYQDENLAEHLEKLLRFFKRELAREVAKKEAGLRFGLEKGRERFEEELLKRHKELKVGLWKYVTNADILTILTSPIIYSGIFFIAVFDAYVLTCQFVCFGMYGLKRVERTGYFIYERTYLDYLNAIQMINCAYCSYGNGFIAYACEVIKRTKPYWDPKKQKRIGTWNYLKNADKRRLLILPILYLGIIPIAMFDVFITVYQHTCFRVYGIPRVRRGEYFLFEKKYFANLNIVQIINYLYGSYGLSVVNYSREVFAKTERHWCPLKHAKKVMGYHDLYDEFAEFGNADEFTQKYMNERKKETNFSNE